MKVLAVVNQKGGVGKTTTAVTLAHGLALMGKRTLLVDLDAQGNVADALGLEKRGGLYELLVGNESTKVHEETRKDDGKGVVTFSGRAGLGCVLSDKTTMQAREVLMARPFREYALREALERVEDGHEVCVLDSAPGADLLQIGALVAADYFIVPMALDHLAVVGALDMLASAAAMARLKALGGQFLGVLPTMWDRTTNESAEQFRMLVEEFAKLVWPPIPRDVKAREAPAHGKTLWEYAGDCAALDGALMSSGNRVGGYRAVLKRMIADCGLRIAN